MKTNGTVVGDMDGGIKKYIKYFAPELGYEEAAQMYAGCTMDAVLQKVCIEFGRIHGVSMDKIELVNRYQEGIRISAYASKKHPAIYVDELFESTLMGFLFTCFLWYEFGEDPEMWGICFSNMLYIFHEQCVLGRMVGEKNLEDLMELVAERDKHLITIVTDCYWAIMVFVLAHELSHIYFRRMGRLSKTKKQKRQEEYDADRFAYDMVLRMIMKDAKKEENQRFLYEYSCMAPMMLMDYFDLYYYTDRVVYKQCFDDPVHPNPGKRKNQLFGIMYKPEYVLETAEAYDLYSAFLHTVHNQYKDELLLKMERGKIDRVIDWERKKNLFQEEDTNAKGY